MNFILEGIISGIKNIVIIITASEFLKAFLPGDNFKKYITVCVNIIVICFLAGEIKNVTFKFDSDFDFSGYTLSEQKNHIKDEYEKNAVKAIKEKLENEKILVYDLKVEADDTYFIENIFASIDGNKEKAENIIKGMKPKNYEINVVCE